MATLVANSPPLGSLNGMCPPGRAPPSPTYSPPHLGTPLTLNSASASTDEPMPLAAPSPGLTSSAINSGVTQVPQNSTKAAPTLRGDASVQLRPAKNLAAFNSLLPPPVDFVEGSSSGTLASSLEGRYEPINGSPKTKLNGLTETPTKAKISPAKNREQAELKALPSLYNRPIDLTWPPNSVRGSGLYNQGNTCFLNSALQCLLHTPPLVRMLDAHTKNECRMKSGFCMSCALRQVMNDSFSKGRAFSPAPITKNLNLIAKHLRKGRQEDAHEFLRYAIDGLQKSCLAGYPPKIDHKLAETTWVHRLFGGRLRSRVTCQQCGYNSDTYDSILDLSIDIYNLVSLKEALKKFTAIDHLKGADKYKCEKCKRPVNAEKQFTIHDAPAVLTVHLKRFTPLGRKLQHPVRYDEQLSLQPVMSQGQHGPTYSLYGVISHMGGGPNSGHYFAHVRAADGQWYEMNDESVEHARRPEPLNMKNAYVLFYIREKGQALQAALNGTGLGNGEASKKRKNLGEAEEKEEEDGRTEKRTQVLIGPVMPSYNTPTKLNPPSDVLKRKIEAVERDRQKEKSVKVQRADLRTLKPLVDYEDDTDEERGERVERSGVTQSNGKGAAQFNGPEPSPSSSPESRKILNGERNVSSPSGPPPTSDLPTPTPSPAEAVAPASFYGPSTSTSSKRKALPDDSGDDMKENSTDSFRWKGRATPVLSPSNASRRTSLGGANPFGKSRIGDNLHASREQEERELFRPRKLHKKQFGGRHRFIL